MKVDGRTLRKDLREFLDSRFPNNNPEFTVQTVRPPASGLVYRPRIEVYFTDLGDPSGSWTIYNSACDFVQGWWRKNERNTRVEGVDTILGAFAQ